MKLDQKWEKDQRIGLICAKRNGENRGAVEDFFDLGRVHGYCKNLAFHGLYIPLYISSGKLEILMVLYATRIWDKLEAIWLCQLSQAQAIDPPSPFHEITYTVHKTHRYFYSE